MTLRRACFPRDMAVRELQRLELANLMGRHYDLGDYHALLAYFALEPWVEEHNLDVADVNVATSAARRSVCSCRASSLRDPPDPAVRAPT